MDQEIGDSTSRQTERLDEGWTVSGIPEDSEADPALRIDEPEAQVA